MNLACSAHARQKKRSTLISLDFNPRWQNDGLPVVFSIKNGSNRRMTADKLSAV
jgi:hypothetical protein